MSARLEYAIVVKAKTRYETLLERFNTAGQARFYLSRASANAGTATDGAAEFEEYAQEHARIAAAVAQVQRELTGVVKSKIVERAFLPSFLFADNQLVIVVGQDGLVANAAKYVRGRPLVAVNPDPDRYDGVLLPFRPDTCRAAVQRVLAGRAPTRTHQLAEAVLNDGQRLLAFNDLFVGAASHVSARYKISFAGAQEEHSSSGIIVATPAGSTGWLSSVFNMTAAVEAFSGGDVRLAAPPRPLDDELLFVVREPFLSRRTQCGLVAGRLRPGQPLQLESLMPAGGVIFSDGVESDFLGFNAGAVATIGPAKEAAQLVQPG
ncbi:NAD(+)/NADH kinase [Hymenobacter caeli]|uniref:NAD kinase n=1 Tax=Hymenobacter caeli TaxID=2735894 RepID=A0ABX2FLD4_9BACT|nr:NAD(+)/NADH kinase [Hymenobacter caeli]NRT17935.1 NAD kinase [Hymenobacter caeli]